MFWRRKHRLISGVVVYGLTGKIRRIPMRSILLSLVLLLVLGPASAVISRAQDTQPTIATVKPAQAAPAASGSANAPGAANASGTQPAAGGAADNGAGGQNQQPPPGLGSFLWPFLAVIAVIYLFLFSGKNKDEKKHKAMLATLKRGDRVVTMGGLIASVVDVRDDEVVLKVDESANVKERYTRSAIVSIINQSDDADKK
jgi:preprotein translocase subunit YajC